MLNDHHVPARLFERFFCWGNLVFWPETFALYDTIPSPDSLCEQFPGLLKDFRRKATWWRGEKTQAWQSLPLLLCWFHHD